MAELSEQAKKFNQSQEDRANLVTRSLWDNFVRGVPAAAMGTTGDLWETFLTEPSKRFQQENLSRLGVSQELIDEMKSKIKTPLATSDDWIEFADEQGITTGTPRNALMELGMGLATGGLGAYGKLGQGLNQAGKFGQAGMVMGAKSKMADLDMLEKAKEMDRQGFSADEIFDATGTDTTTGWWKDARDNWKFEVSDEDYSIDPTFIVPPAERARADILRAKETGDIERQYEIEQELKNLSDFGQYAPPLHAFSNIPSIQRGYPKSDLMSLPSTPTKDIEGSASFDPISGYEFSVFSDEIRPQVLHELQHGVQNIEGFQKGGNPRAFQKEIRLAKEAEQKALSDINEQMREALKLRDSAIGQGDKDFYTETYNRLLNQKLNLDKDLLQTPVKDLAFDKYYRLLGEAEARATADRRKMTIAERQASPLYKSLTMPDRISKGYVPLSMEDVLYDKVKGVSESKSKAQLLREEANRLRFGDDFVEESDSYFGQHRPAEPEGFNTLDDLSDVYPSDVYDPRVSTQYYGTGQPSLDRKSLNILAEVAGNPDAEISIYRAVPKGVKDFNEGDWVTINKDYAEQHGGAWLDDNFDIIEKKVKASELTSSGDSPHEQGYWPKRVIR